MMASIGPARSRRSASNKARSESTTPSTAPTPRASAALAVSGSHPITSQPRSRMPRPTDVPMRPVPEMASVVTRRSLPTESRSDGSHLVGEYLELGGEYGLGAVHLGRVRGGMDIDEKGLGAGGHPR